MREFFAQGTRSYALAVIATGIIALIRLAVSNEAGNFAPLIPFVVAVVVSASYGGLKPGLLATGLSALAADYLFIPARHSLSVQSLTAVVALGVFVLIGILISIACESLHRIQRRLRRSLESERQLQAALAQADRRKDEFLAVLAHELRNPLAAIRSSMHLLQMRRAPTREELEACQAVIERQVSHMTRLIDDLMDVARIARGQLELRKETLDISNVLWSALESSRPLIDARKHDLAVNIPSKSLFLDGDGVRLSQVFSNLLNNAAKYTPPGGRIHLEVGTVEHTVSISIGDSGVGIPVPMLARIFEPFTQLGHVSDEVQSAGMGIGLALVKQLVQLHGGEVTVRSAGIDKGSEFTVVLPLLAADSVPALTRSSEDDSARVAREGRGPRPIETSTDVTSHSATDRRVGDATFS